jgi:pimeloyl-ACP methyl ester carboxylesterase
MESAGHISSGDIEFAAGVGTSRVDPGGFTESAFFDGAGRMVYRLTPSGTARGSVVVCSSLFAELQRNYRREVLLGRALAKSGFEVTRFHYSGAGNSLTGGEVTLETMTRDATEIAVSLSDPVVMVGARLGALAALGVAAERSMPLVAWEPVLDGDRWVEEVLRAYMARGLAEGVTPDTLRRRWEDAGRLSVLGEMVPSSTAETVRGRSFVGSVSGSGPILLVQMGRDERVRPDVEKARQAIAEAGTKVEVLPVVGRQTWWVNEGGDLFRPVERDEGTAGLVDGIVEWIGGVTS